MHDHPPPRVQPVGNVAPAPEGCSRESERGCQLGRRTCCSFLADGCLAGGKAEARQNGREVTIRSRRDVVQAGTRSARRRGQCCMPCGRCERWWPFGGVSSFSRVPRVRRTLPWARHSSRGARTSIPARPEPPPYLQTPKSTIGRPRSCRVSLFCARAGQDVHAAHFVRSR